MYNIRQFKPALYLLVLLGMVGFALASWSPWIGALGCGGVLINAWLVHGGRFRPLPRLAANFITLAAMAIVGRQLLTGGGSNTIMIIGQFLVALQLVKLWEQRANRDFGQILVLSLLLVVAASINTTSIIFGFMLVVYLFLSLYCCLLFHLKVETDQAKAAFVLPEEKISPAVLRQDQRYLSRSMRKLTVIVSAAATFTAVFVFVLFPRGTGQNVLGGMQFSPGQALTGFSEESNLNDISRISQNTAIVAHVELFHDGAKVKGTVPLLLRGLTLDTYRAGPEKGLWKRAPRPAGEKKWVHGGDPSIALSDRATSPFAPPILPPQWKQKFLLNPTGTKVLFAMAGPVSISARRDIHIPRERDPGDGVIRCDEPLTGQLEYEVVSSGILDRDDPGVEIHPDTINRQIADYALRPEVSGADESGSVGRKLLAEHKLRSPMGTARQPLELDAVVAANIERHLRGDQFRYTLDLTDAVNRKGQDPYAWFLSPDGRRGHCEYFAGAMVLMCQSLGINARMVHGFKCDSPEDFNSISDAYIVRQSHAHAWVEVRTTDGWQTFDPTNGRQDDRPAQQVGWWTQVKHFFDYVEFAYATNVIAYDNDSRETLIQKGETLSSELVYRGINSGTFARKARLATLLRTWSESAGGILLTLIALAAATVCILFIWQRIRLRRRVQRIGIDSLPAHERIRLARQLGFYDDLIRLLARHQINRPPHQTAMEFARSLLYLPSDIYENIGRVTAIFYRVRFGNTELTPTRQRRLAGVIARIEAGLADVGPALHRR